MASTGPERFEGVLWITWELQRRNRELARALGIRLVEWADVDRIPRRAVKYLVGCSRTIRLLLRERPKLVIAQNPSIVLAALLCGVKAVSALRVFVDAHNAGLSPLDGRSAFLSAVARWVQRRADLTIVTNERLAQGVEANGGKSFVLPDRIPDPWAAPPGYFEEGGFHVLFVCSFAEDEPFLEVIEAARRLGPGYRIHVTGNPAKSGIDRSALPPNVDLTGYLPDDRFLAAVACADAVMDLTAREDCLVCGAYEALAVARPMILSDTRETRAYFDEGVVYTRHAPEAIAAAVEETCARRGELEQQAARLRKRRVAEGEVFRLALEQRILSVVSAGSAEGSGS